MRMRKKKHLEGRLALCAPVLLSPVCEEKHYGKAAAGQDYIDLQALFGTGAPIDLEIGCGKGGFACVLAARHPETPVLAVEKCANVLVSGCERAMREGLPNLRFLRCGAELLPRYLRPSSVRRIYLNFSCPYPKKAYENHRLTGARFLEIYKRLLVPGGVICQKTDNRAFFEYSVEQLSAAGFALRGLSLDLHNSPYAADNIETEYEARFKAEGKPIYRLEAYLR